jgi:hypothetical protein
MRAQSGFATYRRKPACFALAKFSFNSTLCWLLWWSNQGSEIFLPTGLMWTSERNISFWIYENDRRFSEERESSLERASTTETPFQSTWVWVYEKERHDVTITYDRRTFESHAPDDSNTQQSAITMEDDNYSYFDYLQEGGTARYNVCLKDHIKVSYDIVVTKSTVVLSTLRCSNRSYYLY